MSDRTLTTREKRLLGLCVGVLLLMGTLVGVGSFQSKRRAVLMQIAELQTQQRENDQWLADREFWEKRSAWLQEKMPATDSLGRAQGQLLEEMQNAALDRDITVEQQTLLEPKTTESHREVAVNLRLKGDQTVLLQWLATLQSPERFQVIKELEFDIDTRSREPKPQGDCNVTVARWFVPEPGT